MTTIGKIWTGAVAYVSLLVGAGLSVAGNLADTYRTRGADIDNLDKIMAAAWPILVILAIEMFVSPRWSPKPMFQVWRWVGCLAVGGMAMVVSWTHLHDLMSARGQLMVVAVLGPLAIDGMAIMATGLILSTRVRGHVVTDMQTPADIFESGSYVRDGKTDNPWTDTYVPADTRTGHDRWADLVDGADGRGHSAADMATVKADADKLNGLATWASWTPADDSAVAAMAADVDILPKRTRTVPGQSYPADLAGFYQAWNPDEVKRADMIALLAGHFGVSTRTVRRWVAAYTGQPVSGPPEGE